MKPHIRTWTFPGTGGTVADEKEALIVDSRSPLCLNSSKFSYVVLCGLTFRLFGAWEYQVPTSGSRYLVLLGWVSLLF